MVFPRKTRDFGSDLPKWVESHRVFASPAGEDMLELEARGITVRRHVNECSSDFGLMTLIDYLATGLFERIYPGALRHLVKKNALGGKFSEHEVALLNAGRRWGLFRTGGWANAPF